MPWQDYVVEPEERSDWEPREPGAWLQLDRLALQLRESELLRPALALSDDTLGWTFAAWTRLPRALRLKALVERHVASELVRRLYQYQRIDGFNAIGVSEWSILSRDPFHWPYHRYGIIGIVNITTPTQLTIIDEIEIDLSYLPAQEIKLDIFSPYVPVVAMFSPSMTLFGKIVTPVQSSGMGAPRILRPSERVFGSTPIGLQSPGLSTGFVLSSSIGSDPLLLGAGHVLGPVGNSIVSGGTQIGRVVDHNGALDASVAELNVPWEIDFRLPVLGVIAGPPIMITSGMNVQFVDQNAQTQTGHILQTNFIAPGQASIGLTPYFTTTLPAAGGDSGAPILSGHFLTSAFHHYSSYTDPAVIELYRCALLGHIMGGASGGPAGVMAQCIGIPITEVLAGLQLEPLHR